MILVIFALFIAVLFFEIAHNMSVNWVSFTPNYTAASIMLITGLYYRLSHRSLRISNIAIGFSFLVLFTNTGAKLNYLISQFDSKPIDALLIKLDRMVGYDWWHLFDRVAEYPKMMLFLSIVYSTSLLQIAFITVFLGMSDRARDMRKFLLTGMISSLFALLIWAFFPSSGPAHFISETGSCTSCTFLANEAFYLEHLSKVYNGEIKTVSASELKGLIAFPSMHSVMLIMTLWYTFRTIVFWPIFTLNLPMLPAILLVGSHHLIDVFAGAILFFVSASISKYVTENDPIHRITTTDAL